MKCPECGYDPSMGNKSQSGFGKSPKVADQNAAPSKSKAVSGKGKIGKKATPPRKAGGKFDKKNPFYGE